MIGVSIEEPLEISSGTNDGEGYEDDHAARGSRTSDT
jgi:hypothetical protein